MGLKRMAVLAVVTVLSVGPHGAQAGLIVNGGFETTNFVGSHQFGRSGTTVEGWYTDGYNMLFTPGQADTVGAPTYDFGSLLLWGPGTGVANGLVGSPLGGNFIAADGAFGVGAIKQDVHGLTPGMQYDVSFLFAGAQQDSFDGDTTEAWEVSLDNETQRTEVLQNASHGFTGWFSKTMTFTAQAMDATLSFLALGTPNGVPPFALLDGVSMQATPVPVPEPSTWAVILTGMIGLCAARRRRI